jgi:hypothetical protein
MLALHRSDVTALNDTTRTVLVAEGVVGDWPIHLHGRPYAVGDRIITLHNDHHHRLINGQRGTITSTEADGFAVHFDTEDQPRLVPAAYFEAGHVDHGYAMTVHKAQGLTCDRTYVLATDDLYAEAGYTAISRGRHENRLYITVDDEPDIDHHGAPDNDDPITSIRTALQRSERQQLRPRGSTETLRLGPPSREASTGTTSTSPAKGRANAATVSTSAGSRCNSSPRSFRVSTAHRGYWARRTPASGTSRG